jgi:hypothetical protein
MAIPAISQVTKPDEEKETKQGKSRRTRLQLAKARKVGEMALDLVQTIQLETERDRKDDGRERAILNAATGGAIERLVRSMSLSEADKTFLRERGWRL